jgi:hypothetical protein
MHRQHLIPTRVPALRALVSIALISIVAACSAAAPSGSPAPSRGSGGLPIPSTAPSPAIPSPSAPTATPDPTPKPTPKPTPVWSKAAVVNGLKGCFSVVAAIDGAGTSHLAANCGAGGKEIRYATSTDGRAWTAKTFAPPRNRLELDPQLAFEGNTLYLASTRVALTDGGCGDDGLADVGVYVRSRALPGGDWSEPEQVGSTADHLQSVRVSGGTLHLTVSNEKDGKTYYEALTRGVISRQPIAGAAGSVALRIGDDGKARFAFEAASGIRYGTFDGSRIVSTTIPGSEGGWAPVFVLAPGNAAIVIWNRSYHGLGCAEPGPEPEDGTYLATNASGSWQTIKLSSRVGGASLALDTATGEIQALLGDYKSLTLYSRSFGGDWTKKSLGTGWISSSVIRQNPVSGALLVAYVRDVPEGDGSGQVEVRIRS